MYNLLTILYICTHQQLITKEAMNLKDKQEAYVKWFEGRKEREKYLYYNFTNKNKSMLFIITKIIHSHRFSHICIIV